jgi:hypothetical protein
MKLERRILGASWDIKASMFNAVTNRCLFFTTTIDIYSLLVPPSFLGRLAPLLLGVALPLGLLGSIPIKLTLPLPLAVCSGRILRRLPTPDIAGLHFVSDPRSPRRRTY